MSGPSRPGFSAELDAVAVELADLAAVVPGELRVLRAALLAEDGAPGRGVAARQDDMDERAAGLTKVCHRLLVLQQPVAGDLRLVIAILRMATEIDRSARLLSHTASVVADRAGGGLPQPVLQDLVELCERVATLYGLAVTAFRSRDGRLAADIHAADDRVDDSVAAYRATLRTVFGGAPSDVDVIIDLGLLARYLERIGDHAVTIARQTLFLIGEDAGPAGP